MSSPASAIPSATVSTSSLTGRQRFLWCALGGLVPSLLHLSHQTTLIETIRQVGWTGVVDQVFVAIVAIAIACLIALVFRDETDIRKLIVLGVSAPALLSSWLSTSNANINATQLENFRQAASSWAAPGSSAPLPQSQLTLPAFSFLPPIEAATSEIKPFPKYAPGAFEQLGATLTGSQSTQRNYFVIVASSADPEAALQQKQSLAGRFSGKDVEVYRSPDGYSPVLYCVVVSPNLTFADANTLLKQISPMGFPTAYVWTFGLPLRPPAK
ncbi:MAG TPA: SPOR domain-containing protein [Acidobacteriaceae bacterium]